MEDYQPRSSPLLASFLRDLRREKLGIITSSENGSIKDRHHKGLEEHFHVQIISDNPRANYKNKHFRFCSKDKGSMRWGEERGSSNATGLRPEPCMRSVDTTTTKSNNSDKWVPPSDGVSPDISLAHELRLESQMDAGSKSNPCFCGSEHCPYCRRKNTSIKDTSPSFDLKKDRLLEKWPQSLRMHKGHSDQTKTATDVTPPYPSPTSHRMRRLLKQQEGPPGIPKRQLSDGIRSLAHIVDDRSKSQLGPHSTLDVSDSLSVDLESDIPIQPSPDGLQTMSNSLSSLTMPSVPRRASSIEDLDELEHAKRQASKR
eukprot:scaffold8070_cov117-Cylindrotheca_fusiformis.AAC.17